MGSNQFQTIGHGRDLRDAFQSVRDQEAWEHGHGGYSGTLAEKTDVVLLFAPNGMSARDFADAALDFGYVAAMEREPDPYLRPAEAARLDAWRNDPVKRVVIERAYRVVDDKWGPAGAIELSGGELTNARDEYQRSRGHAIGAWDDLKTTKTTKYLGPEPAELRFFLFFGWASS